MSYTLTGDQERMVRAMGSGLNGSAQDSLVTDVIARLDAINAGSTTPQVRAAATAELSKGK